MSVFRDIEGTLHKLYNNHWPLNDDAKFAVRRLLTLEVMPYRTDLYASRETAEVLLACDVFDQEEYDQMIEECRKQEEKEANFCNIKEHEFETHSRSNLVTCTKCGFCTTDDILKRYNYK